jgi:hypothetical protein
MRWCVEGAWDAPVVAAVDVVVVDGEVEVVLSLDVFPEPLDA